MIEKTLDPSFPEEDATFDFNIYLSVVDKLSAIELVAWDKDMPDNEYLGEAALPLEDWFLDAPGGRKYAWEVAEVRQPNMSHPAATNVAPAIRSRSTSRSCPHRSFQTHKVPSESSLASSDLRTLNSLWSSLIFMPKS